MCGSCMCLLATFQVTVYDSSFDLHSTKVRSIYFVHHFVVAKSSNRWYIGIRSCVSLHRSQIDFRWKLQFKWPSGARACVSWFAMWFELAQVPQKWWVTNVEKSWLFNLSFEFIPQSVISYDTSCTPCPWGALRLKDILWYGTGIAW